MEADFIRVHFSVKYCAYTAAFSKAFGGEVQFFFFQSEPDLLFPLFSAPNYVNPAVI